ncbi:MAG: hypothetical protein C0502_03745 [Opitutus sp.]|nr:hypothetical protein [Opitutus sp.]
MRILLSKPDALGDQLIAAGFAQALRRQWPHARIVWQVRDGIEVIASILPDSEVFRPDLSRDSAQESARLWAATSAPIVIVPAGIDAYAEWHPDLKSRYAWLAGFLRATTWDLAIAPVVNRTGLSDFSVTATNAPRRLGFGSRGVCQPLIEAGFEHLPLRRADFTTEVASSLVESEFAQLARLLEAAAPGATLLPPILRFEAPAPEIADGSVLLAPGVGRNPQRAWALDNFLELAGRLRASGLPVIWIEGPTDADHLATLTPAESAHRLRFDTGQLATLAATIRRARLIVCNDTSYVHLAAALGTPAVALYGAGQRERFFPAFGRVYVVQGDPICHGCQWQCAFDRHICVQDVPPAAVWTAVERQLSAPTSRREVLPLPIQDGAPASSAGESDRVLSWFQEELARIRWDGWHRLTIINDLVQRLQLRDTALASLSAERAALAARLGEATRLPKLSVVIPMGRPERIDGTLQSLVRQTLRPPEWEVIVVGVGASSLPALHPALPIIPVDLEKNLLPPHTRARGVGRATGEWLVFVDDDIRLAPDYFEVLHRVLSGQQAGTSVGGKPVGAIGGRIPGGRGTYFEHLTDISNFWAQQSLRRAVPHSVWFLYSAAIVVRAEAYRTAGGFNIHLPNGEDVDLCQRITASGYLLAYEPALVAWHFHGRDSLFRMWRYFWNNGNAAQFFFQHNTTLGCFSFRTLLVRWWRDIRMNRHHQQTQGEHLGLRLPWVALNYLILEHSLEWHYQRYLWSARRDRDLVANTPSGRYTAAAFAAFAAGRAGAGAARYALAMVLNLAEPVRR